jgi:hypothetical protein
MPRRLRLGDAAQHIEDQLIEDLGGGMVLSDALPKKCRTMRRELATTTARSLSGC